MGVDYIVDLSCPVKEALSSDGLIDLLKRRDRANLIIEFARREGNTKPPSELYATYVINGPAGPIKQNVSAQWLLDSVAPLDPLKHHCDGCNANVSGCAFGCTGYIRYPITAATERWLITLLPTDLDSTAGQLLQRAVKDLGYDGAPIDQQRHRPEMFELRTPPTRIWKPKGLIGKFSTRFCVNSSQMLQIILGLGPLEASHCAMASLFFGLMPHDSPPEVLTDRDTRLALHGWPDLAIPNEAPEVRAFVDFFDALLTAALLEVRLLVDF